MRRRGVIAAALAAAAGAARAQAPAIEWGQIHGTSHQPVAASAAVTPRPLDDKPENLQILRRLGDALRQAGRPMRADGGAGSLALNFDTEIERVPQKLQRGVNDTRGRVKFALTMTVDDPRSGQRLWTGEASYLALPNDETVVFNQLAQMLVLEIGKSSRVRGFTLE